mmetsp:Transcript_13345/g.29527  ORF Transcript_13345/g.29527 Transcript_13345/m.29527 type:complete len:352 (-) Transcript_13345:53-1108(-)
MTITSPVVTTIMKRRSYLVALASALLLIDDRTRSSTTCDALLAPVVSAFRLRHQQQQQHQQQPAKRVTVHYVPSTIAIGTTWGTRTCTSTSTTRPSLVVAHGWLDNFLPKPYDAEADAAADEQRRTEYPEQYAATYELLSRSAILPSDTGTDAEFIRPLLKQTQLECREIKVVYDANVHGWDAAAFHSKVDGCGAAVVIVKTDDGATVVGGYNPKGWSGLGGARPSVASFLFYKRNGGGGGGGGGDDSEGNRRIYQKLRKVGGGGLACANDDPRGGIYFGPDALVIPLQPGPRERMAQSKLGPYFERGPDDLSSILSGGAATLEDLKVWVGVYADGEDVPYSGAVLDMTSG